MSLNIRINYEYPPRYLLATVFSCLHRVFTHRILGQLLDVVPLQRRALLLQESLEQVLESGELPADQLLLLLAGGRLQLLQLALQLVPRISLRTLAERLCI